MFKFQVVLMDKRAYIIDHKDFNLSVEEFRKLGKYVGENLENPEVNKIEITRWNTKTGERE